MKNPRIVWTPQALEVTKIIIHLQDVLMTGIGHCLQDIRTQDYEQFKLNRGAIPFVAALITESCDALLHLKNGGRGTKPKWFLWGEDVKYFSLEVQRCVPIIEKERRALNWDVIVGRLEEMQSQCFNWQKQILAIRPSDDLNEEIYVSQRSAIEWSDLIETLKMGGHTIEGERYRKKH
jgi:hypothetical protein